MDFKSLNIVPPILKALEKKGYETPTPIQEQSIPILLEGRDLLGCAQTGTGKTAAFSIPIIQLLHNKYEHDKQRKKIRALIVTPTRELALQIGESIRDYGQFTRVRHTVVFGGVGKQPQKEALRRGIDILVATPGRLLDLMSEGYIQLRDLEFFVLDEADRMLDMGFIHDVKRIIKAIPEKRHSLFFSATMPQNIVTLSNTILTNPTKVEVTPVSSTAETVKQFVYFVNKTDKRELLIHVLKFPSIDTALVFTRTKYGADKVVRLLNKSGFKSAAIHGNKSQGARQKALKDFKDKRIKVLVATDIAARGIDVVDLSTVINFEVPNIAETYVHRIGRTGRAGAEGKAFSFCDHEEKAFLKDIQKLIGKKIPFVKNHPFPMSEVAPPVKPKQTQNRNPSRNKSRQGNSSNGRSNRSSRSNSRY